VRYVGCGARERCRVRETKSVDIEALKHEASGDFRMQGVRCRVLGGVCWVECVGEVCWVECVGWSVLDGVCWELRCECKRE